MATATLKFTPVITVPCDVCSADGPKGNAHWLPFHSMIESIDIPSGGSRTGSASCAFCQQEYCITISRRDLDLTQMQKMLSDAAENLMLTERLNTLVNEIFSLSVERQSPPAKN